VEDAKRYGPQNIAFILCGNKTDMLEENKDDVEDVSKAAEQFQQSFPYFSSHVLSSCKVNGKLEALKEEIGKQLLLQESEPLRDTISPGVSQMKGRQKKLLC
jgi:GTP-binding protein EngB required for normal cell division